MLCPKDTIHKLDYATKYVIRNGKTSYLNPRGHLYWITSAHIYKRNKQFLLIFNKYSSSYKRGPGINLKKLNYTYLAHLEKQLLAYIAILNSELRDRIKQTGLQPGQRLNGFECTLDVKKSQYNPEPYLDLTPSLKTDELNYMNTINTELNPDFDYLLKRMKRRAKAWTVLSKLHFLIDAVCTAVVDTEMFKLNLIDEYGNPYNTSGCRLSILNVGSTYWCSLPPKTSPSYTLPQPALDITQALVDFDPFTYVASKLYIPKFKPPKPSRE